MRRWLLVVQSLALSALLLCPAPGGYGMRAIGSPDADTAKHLWTLWWMRREALSGEPGLLTRMSNFPEGIQLYPIDPLDGLFSLLVPLPPVPLANVLAFVHLTLLGLAAGWLGRLVSGSRLGGYVAGALAQGSAFAAFSLHVGIGELRQLWWVPLGLGCLIRALDSGERRWFAALSAACAGAALSCFYHGAFLGLSATIVLLGTPARRPNARLGAALALALSLVPAAFAARTFAGSYGPGADPAALVTEEGGVAVDDAGAAAAVEDLYLPRAWARETLTATERAYTGGRYLGLLAVGLALAGVAAAPRRAAPWAAAAAVGAVLALGSAPAAGGVLGTWGLPFAWLNALLARVAEPVNFPARFLAITMVALPVLASLATRWRWTALLVPLAVAEIQLGDLVPWPRETTSLPPVRGLSGRGAFLDLGLALDDSRASRLLNITVQMALASPTQAVPIDRIDRWNAGGSRWVRALPLVQDRVHRRHAKPSEYRPDLALIRDRGFERILVTHPTDGLDPQYEGLLTALCGPPQRSTVATLWTLPPADAAPDELSAWKAEHAVRVAALPAEETPGTYPTSPALQ